MTYTHPCLKCKTTYEDNDPDAYYCEACKEERKRIAEEVDKKMATRETKPIKTALQEYDEAQKIKGFMVVKL